jgi:hypothetical protein
MAKTRKLEQVKKNEPLLFEIDTVYLPALYYTFERDMDFFVPDASGQKEVNLKQIIISSRFRSKKLRAIKKGNPGIDDDDLPSIPDLNRLLANLSNYLKKIYMITGQEIEAYDLLSPGSDYLKYLSDDEKEGLNEIREKLRFRCKGGSAGSFDSSLVEDTGNPKPDSGYEHLKDYADFQKYLVVYYINKNIHLYSSFVACLNGMPTEKFAWACYDVIKYNSGVKVNQNNPLSQAFPKSFAVLQSELKELHGNFLFEQKMPFIEKNEDEIKELRHRFLKYYEDRNVPSFITWLETSKSDEFIKSLKSLIKKGQDSKRNQQNPIVINNGAINKKNYDNWKQEFKNIIGDFD